LQIIRHFYMRTRGNRHRDRATIKTPVVLVTATLTVAILVAALFLIATETRGDNALGRRDQPPRMSPRMSSPHDHL
jgi:hypothetical protein